MLGGNVAGRTSIFVVGLDGIPPEIALSTAIA
jgi:hypothetical protein